MNEAEEIQLMEAIDNLELVVDVTGEDHVWLIVVGIVFFVIATIWHLVSSS